MGLTPEQLERFETEWASIVCDKRGLNKEKVIKELLDYSNFMREVSIVYDNITGGLISKPNTKASLVLAAVNDQDNKILEEILRDEREKWENEKEACIIEHRARLSNNQESFEVTLPNGKKYFAGLANDQIFINNSNPLPQDWHLTVFEGMQSILKSEQKRIICDKNV